MNQNIEILYKAPTFWAMSAKTALALVGMGDTHSGAPTQAPTGRVTPPGYTRGSQKHGYKQYNWP